MPISNYVCRLRGTTCSSGKIKSVQLENDLNKKNLTYDQRVRRYPPVEPTQIAGYVFTISCFYFMSQKYFSGEAIPIYNVCFNLGMELSSHSTNIPFLLHCLNRFQGVSKSINQSFMIFRNGIQLQF